MEICPLKRNVVMQNNQYLFRILLALIILISFTEHATSNSSKESEQIITRLIRMYFPKYSIMDVSSSDSAMINFFKSKYPEVSPFIVQADIDGNKLSDYAFLLTPKDNNKTTFVFAIILQTKPDKYKIVFKYKGIKHGSGVYIISKKSGEAINQTQSINTPIKGIILKNTGIQLIYFERASYVYYWNSSKKQIESIQTGD